MQLEIKQSRNKIELFLEGDLNIALHMIEMQNFAEWTNTTFAVSPDGYRCVKRQQIFSQYGQWFLLCQHAIMPYKVLEVLLMTLFPLKPLINGNKRPLFKYGYLFVH